MKDFVISVRIPESFLKLEFLVGGAPIYLPVIGLIAEQSPTITSRLMLLRLRRSGNPPHKQVHSLRLSHTLR